jgi:dTDP-4-dehydrorhamnose 3,5-epimerase
MKASFLLPTKNKEESQTIKDLVVADLDPFEDDRGQIWTLYNTQDWNMRFVEDKISISTHNVLRGLHGDKTTWKLIGCLNGSFFLAVVDGRENSPTYGNIETFTLSAQKPQLILVPAGCLNGHLCLTDQCIFWYKWSEYYNGPKNQVTIRWDDKDININWPYSNPIISERDTNGIDFKGLKL